MRLETGPVDLNSQLSRPGAPMIARRPIGVGCLCGSATRPLTAVARPAMFNSSAMCRQQAAHHRQVAAVSDLEKVRRIALAAAKAWDIQAREAEAREAGKRPILSAEDAAIAREFTREDEEETQMLAGDKSDPVDSARDEPL